MLLYWIRRWGGCTWDSLVAEYVEYHLYDNVKLSRQLGSHSNIAYYIYKGHIVEPIREWLYTKSEFIRF